MNVFLKYLVYACFFRVLVALIVLFDYQSWVYHNEGQQQLSFRILKKNKYTVQASIDSSFPSMQIRLKGKLSKSLSVGNHYSALVNIWPFKPIYNQGLINVSHLAFPLIAEGQIIKIDKIDSKRSYDWIKEMKTWLTKKIPNHTARPLVQSLFTGEALDDPQLKTLFANTGTSHLTAISGLHVGIIALLMSYITGVRSIKVAAVWMYLMLALFPPSGIRAGLMYSIKVFFPELSLFKVIGITILIHLTWNPFALFSVSCWLSYWAIVLIAMLLKTSSKWFPLKIIINMIPITLLIFHQWPLASIPCNLLAIPFLEGALMPSITIALFGSLLGYDSAWYLPLLFSQTLINFLNIFVNWFIWHPMSLSIWFVVFLQGLLLAFSILKAYRPLIFSSIILYLLFLPIERLPLQKGHFAIVVFNVGQGLSILIKSKSHSWLYDTGPPGSGRKIIIPLLRYYGVNSLDAIIVSHWDLDHRGGLPEILKEFPTKVITSGVEGDEFCRLGDQWRVEGVDFKFIHPLWLPKGSKNKSSCVLTVSNFTNSAILPGDIDQLVEHQILQRTRLEHIDLLIAAHHGSRYSTSREWLSKLTPLHTIVSAGYHNHYHHPHPLFLDRVYKQQSKILKTFDQGTIVFRF